MSMSIEFLQRLLPQISEEQWAGLYELHEEYLEIERLAARIEYYDRLYYYGNANEITDEEYDILKHEYLNRLEKYQVKDPGYQGYSPGFPGFSES